jgi:hypothetical protein
MENTMHTLKTLATPLVLAAVLGLGFGFGVARNAQAANSACLAECNAEFQGCLAESAGNANCYPGFYRCKTWRAACVRACG